jgi:pimeloyl-ACP methyl ester carboxylesterase
VLKLPKVKDTGELQVGFTRTLVTSTLVVGGAVGAIALYNKYLESQVSEPDTVLKGEERRYPWKYGDIFYQVKGSRDAKPLLLIHGFGPGASSYEWRKNVDKLAEQFRVYTLDLLGFGLSDRPAIDYTAETYADLISDFLKEAIGKPTVVVAHGLTCAYVVADAYRRPQLFERLVLVSPPLNILEESFPGPFSTTLKFVLRTPILGQFIYNTLTSRGAIRNYYDEFGYQNPGLITDELVEYTYSNAHQANNRYPAASLLSNGLVMDIQETLARLQVPVIAIWGREDIFSLPEASDVFKRVNSNVDIRVLDKCRQQPQDEQAEKFNALVSEFAGATVTQ